MIDLVYILSPAHSGSTVLGMLLGAHPQVATVGELKMVPWSFRNDETCSCGVVMRHCGFWKEVADRLRARGMDLTSAQFRTHVRDRRTFTERLVAGQVRGYLGETVRSAILRVRPGAGRFLHEMLACNIAIMHVIAELTERSVFLDTSKDASRLRYLAESGRFRISVLHLIRDGRAVANSLIRKGVDSRLAAQEWVEEHYQAERLRVMNFGATRWVRVHYEKFCADPDGILASVCEFIGVRAADRTLDFRSWDSHVLGNRLRLSDGRGISFDESWRRELTEGPLAIVEAVTAKLNRRYGYA